MPSSVLSPLYSDGTYPHNKPVSKTPSFGPSERGGNSDTVWPGQLPCIGEGALAPGDISPHSHSCHSWEVGSPLGPSLLCLLSPGSLHSSSSLPNPCPRLTPYLGVVVNESSAAHAAAIVARGHHDGGVSPNLGHAHGHLHGGLSGCRKKEGVFLVGRGG